MMTAVDGALILWFTLVLASALYTLYDLLTRTPAMGIMKPGWVLVVLYTGPIGLFIYLLSCREPLPGTHEKYISPLWKQAVGSTIHCVAGDATGIILGAVIAMGLRLPMALDVVLEYVAGFAFGLFIFQALFMKGMAGGDYLQAVKRTLFPEWLSMNALMGGMIPVMVIIMTHDAASMEPSGLRFWGVMSLAIMTGAVAAYPFNVWLVSRGLKHGMGTERVLGKGGHSLAAEQAASGRASSQSMHHGHAGTKHPGKTRRETILVTLASLALLVLGAGLALWFGNMK